MQQELINEGTRPAGSAPAREQITVTPSASQGGQAEMQWTSGTSNEAFMGTCPDCGSQLEFAEGCVKCHVCGFSECG